MKLLYVRFGVRFASVIFLSTLRSVLNGGIHANAFSREGSVVLSDVEQAGSPPSANGVPRFNF
jgi:hypothetical protein